MIVGRDFMYSKMGPVGACIYCGAVDGLTDEHIIPLSLDGNIQLVDASCLACAAETAKFEGVMARTVFGNMRMRYGFPTRRKKQRLDTLPLKVEKAGVIETIEIPTGQHPAVTPIVFFEPCGILSGYVGPERPVLVRVLANDGVTPSDLGGDAIHVDLKPCVAELRRFLAKIAHCFAVLNLGLDGFSPWLVPLILRGEGDTEALIGGDAVAPLEGARPDRSNVHQMLLRIYQTKTHGDVCVVHVGLFCNWFADGSADRMPSYHVVVGAATQLSWERLQSPLFYSVLSQREIERGTYVLSDQTDLLA